MTSLPDTLCWTCRNAVPNLDGSRGCSWSKELKPVEGWTARKTHFRYGKFGFLVKKCPEYEYDKVSCRMQGSTYCKAVHMRCDYCPFKKELSDEGRVCQTTQESVE